MAIERNVDRCIKSIPEPREIKERLSETLAEAKLLRRLLKLAQDKSIVGARFAGAGRES